MLKVWSFNTTVREPGRMTNFLNVLSEIEGTQFDHDGQEKYFGLLIKKRLYKPTKLKLVDPLLIQAVHDTTLVDDLDESVVEKILMLYRGQRVDGAGRGRTAAGILNRFGLCVALQSKGAVVITELGKKWLNGDISDENLFTKFFLKWQYPNPIESGYEDFNIKPFIGVILLIKRVNDLCRNMGLRSVGISRDEWLLYVPSLIKVSQIDEYANAILDYRSKMKQLQGHKRAKLKENYHKNRAVVIFGPNRDIQKDLNKLRDYTDSSIRYFRVSGLVSLRGSGTHIDLAKDGRVEADAVASTLSPEARHFINYQEYFNYLSDINSLNLPWENETDLQKIVVQLSKLVREESGLEQDVIDPFLLSIRSLTLKKQIDSLRIELNNIRVGKLRGLKHDLRELNICIDKLNEITGRNYSTLTSRPSLDLEWFISRAFMVLNDAVEIRPSFTVGDDGIPLGFSPGVSDLECSYDTFAMTVEVTMERGRDQSFTEGQPVPRHLRDFEKNIVDLQTYCLFIAPQIHRDTMNTFWICNKYGYEGRRQNIVPFSLAQFLEILSVARKKIEAGVFDHKNLSELLRAIIMDINKFENSIDWLNSFPAHIQNWSLLP